MPAMLPLVFVNLRLETKPGFEGFPIFFGIEFLFNPLKKSTD